MDEIISFVEFKWLILCENGEIFKKDLIERAQKKIRGSISVFISFAECGEVLNLEAIFCLQVSNVGGW